MSTPMRTTTSVGWHEGRDPNAFFSTVVYLSANPDVKAAGVNPLDHFDSAGWKEGRVPSIDFDPRAVSRRQSGREGGAASIRCGTSSRSAPAKAASRSRRRELHRRRTASTTSTTCSNNPDVAAAGVDPFQHFQTVGWKEGRNPNALFDTNGYLATYTDVQPRTSIRSITTTQFGWHEGRDPSVGFDTTSYLAAYADVAAAHVNPLMHFLQFGIHEGRSAFADGVWG